MDRVLSMVNGISGYGKSYFAKNTLIPVLAKFTPVIIFDKNSEYAGENARDIPKGAKWKHYTGIFDFLKKNQNEDKFGGVHVISCSKLSDYNHGIRFFYALKQPVTLIIDEGHFIFDEPKLKDLSAVIKNIARFGRHSGLGLIMISQRSIDIPTDVRSQFEGLISFKQSEPSDVEYLKKRGWENVDKILEFEKKEFQIYGTIPKDIKIQLTK